VSEVQILSPRPVKTWTYGLAEPLFSRLFGPGLGEILEVTTKVAASLDAQTIRCVYSLLKTLLTLKTKADRVAEVEKGRAALKQKLKALDEKVNKVRTALREVLAENKPPVGQKERRACMMEMERILEEQLDSPVLN
jgi:Zn-dependent M32 family carboxypeptidase